MANGSQKIMVAYRLTLPLLLLLLSSCTNLPLRRVTTGLPQTSTPAPQRQSTPATADGWTTIDEGLEKRTIQLRNAQGVLEHQLYLLRIDPLFYRFDIAYQPGQPQTLEEWLAQTDAQIVVNGGYFTEEYVATGLIIDDGIARGSSYQFGGMLTMRDGVPALRALVDEPYVPGEMVEEALQSFPLLIDRAGNLYNGGGPERARRTFIGQDAHGRIIIGVSALSSLSLAELASLLAASDLNLQIALNLDGGTSSGLLLGEPYEIVPAFALLPAVLAVSKR